MPEYRLKVDDKEYAFDPKMVTPEVLIHIKQWYGRELGRYNNFIEAFFEGDPDAALCAIWIARRAAGETNVPEPKKLDGSFTLCQWLDVPEVQEEAEEENPTVDTPPPTPASTETPSSSGESTDGPSPQPSAGSSET